MSVNFGGGSTIYLMEEATYNDGLIMTAGNANTDKITKLRIRPGAIPSVSNNRVHARSTGGYMDRSHSYPVRKMVSGSYGFNIGSGKNQNLIHKWAGLDTTVDATSRYFEDLKSFRILHPIFQGAGSVPVGVPYDGFIYQGMMISQYSLNLPSDNSLLESNMTLVGAKMFDTIQGDAVLAADEKAFITSDGAGTTISKTGPGAPFEVWTASIVLDDAVTLSVRNFSININNGLVAGNYINSGESIGRPRTSARTVTGQFTIPYDKGHYKTFTDNMNSFSETTYDIKIQLQTSRSTTDEKDQITITMPAVSILGGSTPNTMTGGVPSMNFSFTATGSRAVANQNEIFLIHA